MGFILSATAWLLGLSVVVIVVAYVVDMLFSCSRGKGEPPVWRGGLPLIGHFLRFSKNPLGVITEGYNKLGPVFTMQFLNNKLTFLVSTEAQAPFFKGNDNEMSQSEPYKFMTPIFGEGIVFDAPNDVKAEQLKFVGSALKGSSLRRYVDKIADEVSQFLEEKWGDDGEKDLLEEMAQLTILTASACLLGPEIRGELFGEFSNYFKEIDEGINPIAIFFPYAPLPAFRRRDAARVEIAKIFGRIIAKRRSLAPGDDKPDDMLQKFMDAVYTSGTRAGQSCTDDQITGMLIGTLFAGQHTSSITSTWTILNLLNKPALMTRAMDEIVGAFGPAPVDKTVVNYDSVNKCSFIHDCMKESLRIAPPLIMLMRKVKEPFKVGDVTVPAGHLVFAPVAVSMNLPNGSPHQQFKDPDDFDPDRFSPPRSEGKNGAFCAFGGGSHACLGEMFGYLQVKTIVTILLRRYELKAVGPLPKPNHQAMVVGPLQTNKSCVVTYKRRKTPLVTSAAASLAAGQAVRSASARAGSPSRGAAVAR